MADPNKEFARNPELRTTAQLLKAPVGSSNGAVLVGVTNSNRVFTVGSKFSDVKKSKLGRRREIRKNKHKIYKSGLIFLFAPVSASPAGHE